MRKRKPTTLEDRAKKQLYDIRYRALTKARKKELNRIWYVANKEAKNASSREWLSRNSQRFRDYKRQWEVDHPEIKIDRANWQKQNRDKCRSYTNKHRALRITNGGTFTSDEWDKLCQQYHYRCLGAGPHGGSLSVDHVVPLSRGGTNDIANIQPLCCACNSRKRDRVIDFREG